MTSYVEEHNIALLGLMCVKLFSNTETVIYFDVKSKLVEEQTLLISCTVYIHLRAD